MPRSLFEVHELQTLLDESALLVEVLPRAEYEEEHMPGAISIPLKDLSPLTVQDLDRDRPIVVYCHDYQ
jgi:rhodanese-related sulfurtransferase